MEDIELSAMFRNYEELRRFQFYDEHVSTVTSREQQKVEISIEKCFDRFQQLLYCDPKIAKLHREQHQHYLEPMLHHLPVNYECLDSSRPWNIYWILQAAYLLNIKFSDKEMSDIIAFLECCREPNGGFGGGPGQYAHLAPTYAAVNTLCMIGTTEAYNAIDRNSLIKFLYAVRQPNGAFKIHLDGETDVRGAYCAISCAKLINLPTDIMDDLFNATGDWIASCQTYEGGFGGAPFLEAHGGYTFCAVAGLALLNEGHKCDRQRLLKWTLQRQMSYEGGFQGRTNKLVDGCYSFWVGATIPIAQTMIAREDKNIKEVLFDPLALQEYIILCCQKVNGGLIDKPGKPQDLYHTCYTLSGISIAQHSQSALNPQILGDPVNEVLPTHPLFNIPPFAVAASLRYFQTINASHERHEESPVGNGTDNGNTNATEDDSTASSCDNTDEDFI